MADGVSKTVAFLATYCQELVRLQKPTLESVLPRSETQQKNFGIAKGRH